MTAELRLISASTLDEKARKIADEYLNKEGELLSVLVQMRQEKLFAALNYSGIFDYCVRAIRLSRSQGYYFQSVARKSQSVPQLKAAVVQGEITLSQARRIAPVVTSENYLEWLKKAKTLPQKELEREVARVNPNARITESIRPVAEGLSEMRVAVNARTEENVEALQDILSQKLQRAASLGEVVAWAVEVCRDKFDPIRRAKRARSVSSGNKERPTKAGVQPVRAAVKHEVALRDDRRCTYVSPDGRRCNQRRWLQLHHIKPVARGGTNALDNLRTLCRAHHALIHTRGTGEPAPFIISRQMPISRRV